MTCDQSSSLTTVSTASAGEWPARGASSCFFLLFAAEMSAPQSGFSVPWKKEALTFLLGLCYLDQQSEVFLATSLRFGHLSRKLFCWQLHEIIRDKHLGHQQILRHVSSITELLLMRETQCGHGRSESPSSLQLGLGFVDSTSY